MLSPAVRVLSAVRVLPAVRVLYVSLSAVLCVPAPAIFFFVWWSAYPRSLKSSEYSKTKFKRTNTQLFLFEQAYLWGAGRRD